MVPTLCWSRGSSPGIPSSCSIITRVSQAELSPFLSIPHVLPDSFPVAFGPGILAAASAASLAGKLISHQTPLLAIAVGAVLLGLSDLFPCSQPWPLKPNV